MFSPRPTSPHLKKQQQPPKKKPGEKNQKWLELSSNLNKDVLYGLSTSPSVEIEILNARPHAGNCFS